MKKLGQPPDGGGGPAAVKYYNDAPLVIKVYVIKIAVCGVSPMVWRRLRIAANKQSMSRRGNS